MEESDLRLSDMLREEVSKTTDPATAERLRRIADDIDARTLFVVIQDGVVKSTFANKFKVGSTAILHCDRAESHYAIDVPDGLVDGVKSAVASFLQVDVMRPAPGEECAIGTLATRAEEMAEVLELDQRSQEECDSPNFM